MPKFEPQTAFEFFVVSEFEAVTDEMKRLADHQKVANDHVAEHETKIRSLEDAELLRRGAAGERKRKHTEDKEQKEDKAQRESLGAGLNRYSISVGIALAGIGIAIVMGVFR